MKYTINHAKKWAKQSEARKTTEDIIKEKAYFAALRGDHKQSEALLDLMFRQRKQAQYFDKLITN
jgi:hypothetical protein